MYKERPIPLRPVFQGYAVVVGIAGILLLGWGPVWFRAHLLAQPFGEAALIRLAGGLLVTLACCAVGFSAASDALSLRRGMLWFAVGHMVICVVVESQRTEIWHPE